MTRTPIEPATSAYAYPLLIKHLLGTHSPEQEIVYADFVRYDYRTLRQRIGRLASGLTALGVRPGDTVAVMDWDSHRYLECFFAVPMLGAVLHTVNIRLSPDQILYTVNHAEDDVILLHADFVPLLEQIADRMEKRPRFILLEDDGVTPETTLDIAARYEPMLEAADADHVFEDFDENTRATTFYTTGTTGDPKGVYYSHRQLVLHTLSAMAGMASAGVQGRFYRDDVYMPITPMFHVHAWGLPYVATVMGVKQVYPGRYLPDKLLSLMAKEKVTFSHCVPTILHMLLSHADAASTDLSRWTVVIGGSALPSGLAQKAMDMGIDVFGGYGMSETGPVLTIAQLESQVLDKEPNEQLEIRCKAGRTIPLVDVRVVDEQMNDVPHDGATTGEVVVRAPWLTQSYLKNPDASEALWQGGYLHTGDIGHIDGQGYLKITDRLKDVVKSGGEWISSLALEDIISGHPGVSEVAVIGVHDDKWGERPLPLVVRAAEGEVNETGLIERLQACADTGEIPTWAVPEQIRFVDEIDKTSVGKINKKLLREKYGGA